MDSHDSTFFLPPHFFSLAGKPSVAADFPTHVHAVPASDTDADNDDEEDFLAALTLRLTQSTLRGPYKFVSYHESHAKTVVAGSPQSTLSGFGSWPVSSDGSPNGPSQAPSPPTTPYGDDTKTSDLIYAAAEQVARLKMNTHTHTHTQSSSNFVSSIKNAGFYSYPSQLRTELPICTPDSCFNWGRKVKVENQQIHGRVGDSHRENGRFVVRPEDFPQYTRPCPQPLHRRNPSQPCAPAPKKQCAGTGVFLPRRHGNNSLQQSYKRTDCGSIALFPGKNVQDANRSVPHEALIMAQRNAILSQQRLSFARPAEISKSYEFLLPQEWTY